MPDWINSPRYQRVIQRMQTMQPWQRAIFTSAGADKAFASEEMRGKIDAINAATTRQGREQAVSSGKERLALSRGRFEASTGLADRERDIETKDRRTAEYLGYGNIGVSGLLGYKEMELKNIQAAQEQAMRRKILGATRGLVS